MSLKLIIMRSAKRVQQIRIWILYVTVNAFHLLKHRVTHIFIHGDVVEHHVTHIFLYARDASGNTGHKMLYIQHTVIIQQSDNMKIRFCRI